MPYPSNYERVYDFLGYQAANPTRPLPGDKMNAEFNEIENRWAGLVAFLRNVVRSDGALANGSVGPDQLAPEFELGFSYPSVWTINTDYTVGKTVFYSEAFYQANVEHNSGASFDVTKWDLIADFSGVSADANLYAPGWVADIVIAPTGAEAEGARYLVAGSGATGTFAGKENYVAQLVAGTWEFGAPADGQQIYVQDEQRRYKYNSANSTWKKLRSKLVFMSDFTTLTLAAAFAVAASAVLVIDESVSLTANTTLTVKSVHFAGGDITTAGYNLTLPDVAAPRTRIFDAAGTGVITISSGYVKAEWYGVDLTGNAAVDSTNAFSRALKNGNTITIGNGLTYANLTFSNLSGTRLRGINTQLFPYNTALPAVTWSATGANILYGCELSGFWIYGANAASSKGIYLSCASPAAIYDCKIEHVRVETLNTGLHLDCPTGEIHHCQFEDLTILGTKDYGILVTNGVYNQFSDVFIAAVYSGYALSDFGNAQVWNQFATDGKVGIYGAEEVFNGLYLEWDSGVSYSLGGTYAAPAYPAVELGGHSHILNNLAINNYPAANCTDGLYINGSNQRINGLVLTGAGRPTNDYSVVVGASYELSGWSGNSGSRIIADGTTTYTIGDGQLKFPVTQNASTDPNTMDDYEEGTFTPTLTFGGAAVGMTFSLRSGRYIKVGKKVWVQIALVLSAKGASVGTAVVGALPFTSVNATVADTPVAIKGLALLNTIAAIDAMVSPNTTQIAPSVFAAGTGTAMTEGSFTGTSQLYISADYEAAA